MERVKLTFLSSQSVLDAWTCRTVVCLNEYCGIWSPCGFGIPFDYQMIATWGSSYEELQTIFKPHILDYILLTPNYCLTAIPRGLSLAEVCSRP